MACALAVVQEISQSMPKYQLHLTLSQASKLVTALGECSEYEALPFR
jgi:hypothetical protein